MSLLPPAPNKIHIAPLLHVVTTLHLFFMALLFAEVAASSSSPSGTEDSASADSVGSWSAVLVLVMFVLSSKFLTVLRYGLLLLTILPRCCCHLPAAHPYSSYFYHPCNKFTCKVQDYIPKISPVEEAAFKPEFYNGTIGSRSHITSFWGY